MWDPQNGPNALDADAWDDALELLDACGPDSRAQLCRTTSTEQGPVTPRPLGSPQGSGLSACMLAESKSEVRAGSRTLQHLVGPVAAPRWRLHIPRHAQACSLHSERPMASCSTATASAPCSAVST